VLSDSASAEVKNLVSIPAAQRDASVRIVNYSAGEAELETSSKVPFLLASSEKLTPELRVMIDGEVANTVEINGMFTGVAVGSGEHSVRFDRRIGRGGWAPALIGLLMLGAGTGWEARSRKKTR